MGLQSYRNPHFKNFKTHNLGVPWQNDIWVQGLWVGIQNTIKGKVMASPSLGYDESCEFVFAHGSFLHQKCSNYALINLLFGLCKSVWIIDSLITHPSPYHKALARPSTPDLLRTMERTPIHCPFVIFTFGFVIESIKEFGGASP